MWAGGPSPLSAECFSEVYSTARQAGQRMASILLPLLTHGKSAALPPALVSVVLLSRATDRGHKMGLDGTQHCALTFLIIHSGRYNFILAATHKRNTGVSISTVYISVSHAMPAAEELSVLGQVQPAQRSQHIPVRNPRATANNHRNQVSADHTEVRQIKLKSRRLCHIPHVAFITERPCV
ncbi:hypothetical protein NQZ68_004916 [Dissostichus eleginoides]|nr:hypothetical protein NQZ68_004916 [Dissostichus eleginoides]